LNCPLCLNIEVQHYHTDKFRVYYQCDLCALVFVDSENYLSQHLEKLEYNKHQNNPYDFGYCNFLNKLIIPLNDRLKANSSGLDFGCGPGATLSILMLKLGHVVANYDLFYAKDPRLLLKKYDFICCTEVVEHLHNPFKEFMRLHDLLMPNGLLGIMTKRVINKQKFINWHYKNDLTHVCFFHELTFDYIAGKLGFELEFINSDTIIMKKVS
jgi:2-polyprenyl-3-methyl-5-hydroxy-6-metoxy-1,4-benzoquinol methylase